MGMMKLSWIKKAWQIAAAVVIVLVAVWGAGVIYFCFDFPQGLRFWGMIAFVALMLGDAAAGFKFRFCWLLAGIFELALILYFAGLTPEKVFAHTVFEPSWRKMPEISYAGTEVEINNIRNFQYRSVNDFDERYLDDTFDLNQLESMWVAVSYWGGNQDIAHTMVSFGFADDRFLAVSNEIRLPVGVPQDFLRGLYKRYEIISIFGTESDLFRLRTDFRRESLYLYRTNATPEQARTIFCYLAGRAEDLRTEPEFYNSLTRNCTTSLAPALRLINPSFTHDIRLLLNGESDQLLFDLGYLAHRDGESFDELKRRSLVPIQTGVGDADYSAAIRSLKAGTSAEPVPKAE